jgi:hypothetical protein
MTTEAEVVAHIKRHSPIFKGVLVHRYQDPSWICNDPVQGLRMIEREIAEMRSYGCGEPRVRFLKNGSVRWDGSNEFFWVMKPFDPEVRAWAKELEVA